MSISRRQFILGTAAGLILPSYYDKVLAYCENHGEALIEVPKTTEIELIASYERGGGWSYELNLGDRGFGIAGKSAARDAPIGSGFMPRRFELHTAPGFVATTPGCNGRSSFSRAQ